MSRYLSSKQLTGLAAVGDIYLPGGGGLAAFSKSSALSAIDRAVAELPTADRESLALLLGILGMLPRPLLRRILAFVGWHRYMPNFIATPLRLIDVGLTGIVYSLYYGQKSTTDAIGWNVNIHKRNEDLTMTTAPVDTAGDDPKTLFARARAAQPELKQLPMSKRIAALKNLRLAILERQEAIIDLVQKETGKSRTDALVSEIFSTLDHLAYLEKQAGKILSDRAVSTPMSLMGKKSLVYFEPMGTILVISPWNYPFYQAIVPITSAFVCGNAVVFKPSEYTPLRGLVEEILHASGFAADWVQIAYGDGVLGERLIAEKPEKIFFTGSVRTGKKIMAQASQSLIPVELELGGKDPMVVFADAHIERAAAGAVWGAFTNTGQSCTSVERVYVEKSIYPAFSAAVKRRTLALKQSVDTDGNADIGRMTTAFQTRTVAEHLKEAQAAGAVVTAVRKWDGNDPLVPASVIEGAPNSCQALTEETFGPTLPLVPFTSEAEAIALANDSIYGLSASVWTADLTRAKRVARALATGNVSINNVMLTEGNPALPFGGTKQSGFGRYKGEFGLYSFSNVKSIIIDKNSKKMEANWFPYTAKKYTLLSHLIHVMFGGGPFTFFKIAINGLKLESYSQKVGEKGRDHG